MINVTKKIALREYFWYCMPISLHKLLIHEADSIKYFISSIGQLLEEPLQRHKVLARAPFKKNIGFSTNKDLTKTLIISSDPYKKINRKNRAKMYKAIDESHFHNFNDCEQSIISIPNHFIILNYN